MILNTLQRTYEFIDSAERLCKNAHVKSLDEFHANASLLGSLPAVPDLKEVPYISFHFDDYASSEILRCCSDLGSVSQIAPVQVISHKKCGSCKWAIWFGRFQDLKRIPVQF